MYVGMMRRSTQEQSPGMSLRKSLYGMICETLKSDPRTVCNGLALLVSNHNISEFATAHCLLSLDLSIPFLIPSPGPLSPHFRHAMSDSVSSPTHTVPVERTNCLFIAIPKSLSLGSAAFETYLGVSLPSPTFLTGCRMSNDTILVTYCAGRLLPSRLASFHKSNTVR